MILWAILTLCVAVVAVAITIPLVRRHDAGTEVQGISVLVGQLNDIDEQQKANVLTAHNADQMRLEIKRRMLAESHAPQGRRSPFDPRTLAFAAFGVVGFVALGAVGLYAVKGQPDQAAVAPSTDRGARAGAPAAEHPAGDVDSMIRSLEARLEAEPDNAEGWRMLGWSYFQTRRFAESAEAYGRARKIDPTDPAYASAMGESLVQAAGGKVTPEARGAFETAYKLDRSDARARYFLAVLKDQQGNTKGAIDDWLALLNESPADAPWVPHLRQTVTDAARTIGLDVSGRLPTAAAATPDIGMPVPSAAEIAAADQMAPDDRQAMILGMVNGLADRLKDNPRDPQGWIRLMRARMLLGDTAGAITAYRSAQQAFANDADVRTQLKGAATEFGVPVR